MNPIAEFVKENRKAAGLTQEQFALRSGLGLRFVRELEQGKETVRMDKVNVALAMFNAQAVAGKKEDKWAFSEQPMFMWETPLPVSSRKQITVTRSNMPADKEQFALAMNGKKMNIRKGDFLKFADTCGITRQTAEKLIENLVKLTPKWIAMCENSLLTDKLKDRLKKIIIERTEVLQ